MSATAIHHETRLAPDALGPTVAIGEILVEIMARSRGNGFLEPIELVGPYPSGAPAIFIDQCAKIGGAAAMVASVGNDDFGRINIERLRSDGADVSAISVSPDYPTGSAFVRYRDDGSRDFVYNIGKSAAALVSLTAEAKALFARAGHLHVMGTAFAIPGVWEVMDYAIGIIKQRGGSVSLDPNLRKELLGLGQTQERFARLVDVADLILPSGEELFIAAGVDGGIGRGRCACRPRRGGDRAQARRARIDILRRRRFAHRLSRLQGRGSGPDGRRRLLRRRLCRLPPPRHARVQGAGICQRRGCAQRHGARADGRSRVARRARRIHCRNAEKRAVSALTVGHGIQFDGWRTK